MHTKASTLAWAVALALGSASAWSANLLDAYQAAVKSDPTILGAQSQRMAALEAKPQALGLLLPQVSANGQSASESTNSNSNFPQAVDTNNDGVPDTVVIIGNKQESTSNFWRYQLQVTQTIFDWNQWQNLQKADSQVALAEANYRAAEQDLMVRVAGRYFDVLAARDTLTAAEATLEAVTRQLEQAEKRFEVGLIAITDVQEARAAHDNAVAGVILAKRTLATAEAYLREITGEEYQELDQPSADMPLDQPEPGDQQTWVTKAEAQNLNVIAARLDVDIAKANVKMAESGHMPIIQFYGQYNDYHGNNTQTNNGLTGNADSNQDQTALGVQMTLPIFSGGVTQSQVRQQVYLHRAARDKLEGAMRSAERETSDAYFGVVAEKARVKALKQAVASNKTALEATEAGFEVGTRTTVDVLNARQNLFQAERDYARSRYDYLINVVNLKSAAGVLVPGDLASINGFLTSPTELKIPKPTG
jgi:outer membrane protein